MNDNRIPVDQRELIDDDSVPATRKPIDNSRFVKNADSWRKEAESSLDKAIRYYDLAADWYDKAGELSSANRYRELAKTYYEMQK